MTDGEQFVADAKMFLEPFKLSSGEYGIIMNHIADIIELQTTLVPKLYLESKIFGSNKSVKEIRKLALAALLHGMEKQDEKTVCET